MNEDTKLNEAGGRFFEFLTVVLLEELLPDNKIVWQPKIKNMQLQPDVGIYNRETERLIAIGLVGHATIKSSGSMKTNRNIEELFEIKEFREEPVLALSFIWHSPNGWTAGHIGRLDAAFDYNFVAFRECKENWPALLDKIGTIVPLMAGQDEDSCKKIIRDSELFSELIPYFSELQNLMNESKERNADLWSLVRSNYKPIKLGEDTISSSIKLAMQPLIWLPEFYLDSVLSGKTIPFSEETEAFARLGGGIVIIGDQIRISSKIIKLATCFDKKTIKGALLKIQTAEGVLSLTGALGSIDALSRRISRTKNAIETHSLFELCENAIKETDEDFINRCWPFDVCTAWIKNKVDPKFGLLEAQRVAIGDTLTDYLWDPIIRFTEGNYNLLSRDQLNSICAYFERTLMGKKAITPRDLSNMLLVESRKKKDLNPLPWLLSESLRNQGIAFRGFPDIGYSFQCLFTKMAGIGVPSGLTTYQFNATISGQRTIIHVLSSFSSTHKDVEYSSKARVLKYRKKDVFKYLDDINLVYVLDGNWSKRHLNMFRGAGAEVVSIEDFTEWLQKRCASKKSL